MDQQEKTEMPRSACDRIMSESNAVAFAVALLDYETGFRFALNAGRRFHAASTIKVAIDGEKMSWWDSPKCGSYNPIISRTYFTGGLPNERTVSLYFFWSNFAPSRALACSRSARCSVTPTK